MTHNKDGIWYSADGEYYQYTDIDEAIDSAIEYTYEYEGKKIVSKEIKYPQEVVIYRGEAVTENASYYLPEIGDGLLDRAADDAGEHADIWYFGSELSKKLQTYMEKSLDEFCNEHNCQPSFFLVPKPDELRIEVLNDKLEYKILDERKAT